VLLPLSDAPNPGGRPYVTYGLIAANILVYLLVSLPLGARPPDTRSPVFQAYVELVRDRLPAGVPLRAALATTSAYDLYVFEHGYKPAAPQVADLFYAQFLHGGFLHLFGNMLFLWIFGDNVEYRLGRVAYLLAYLATGVAATLFFALFAFGSAVPLVGASGAISGVLGFYFLWFPRNTVRLFVFLFPFFMNVVAVRARLVLGAYLLVDNLLPFLISTGGGGGVAHGAHIGGFVAGLAGAWMIERRALLSGKAGYEPEAAVDQAPAATIGPVLTGGAQLGEPNGVQLQDRRGGQFVSARRQGLELMQALEQSALPEHPDVAMGQFALHAAQAHTEGAPALNLGVDIAADALVGPQPIVQVEGNAAAALADETRPAQRYFTPARQQMAPSAAIPTETLTLHGATLGTGPRLFEAVGHVAPAHIRRPPQHVFGGGTDPFTDHLTESH